ncbi:MAG: alpha/beta hydrolase, partial [Clostridium lundense]|nr:alpha/beta hydrolase [Clostridium lundense]
MILYEKNKPILRPPDGAADYGYPIRDTYVQLGRNTRGLLYKPRGAGGKSRTAVVVIHSDTDYSVRPIAGALARRGYLVFAGNVSAFGMTLDEKLLELKKVVSFLRTLGERKIVLMGHSGGATLMSAYQAVAENGAEVFRSEELIYRCTVDEPLPPADGVMLLDANWGNGAMTLFSVDPAVIEEGNGVKLDPQLDIFNPDNGYDSDGCHYSQAFRERFYAAQRERSNALIRKAQERLYAIENGKGFFNDDEPFIVAGGEQGAPSNRMLPQDTNLLAHTKKPYPLLMANGKVRN